MRFPWLFQPDVVCGPFAFLNEERFTACAPLLTEFMVSIRHMLDAIGKQRGRRLLLGVRVPDTPELNRAIGIDLPAWLQQVGPDYLVPSGFITTDFNIPVDRFKELTEAFDCPVYPCIFPSVNVASAARGIRCYQTELYTGAAANFYGSGADGVQVFNHFHPPLFASEEIRFNVEALCSLAPRRFSRAQDASQTDGFPVRRYHIASSAEPPTLPGFVKGVLAPIGGVLQTRYDRLPFQFRFGEELDDDRRLDLFRFKLFEMTPEDGRPQVWVNEAEVDFKLSWRYGPAGRDWSWDYGIRSGDLELLAGGLIEAANAQQVNELLKLPAKLRTAHAERQGWTVAGPEIFMLVEVARTKPLADALHGGLNHLWVRLGDRREHYTFEPAIGDLEIRTVTNEEGVGVKETA